MCIRDRWNTFTLVGAADAGAHHKLAEIALPAKITDPFFWGCLLYTSDAADERSSVDLGGRRIIKKKNTVTTD